MNSKIFFSFAKNILQIKKMSLQKLIRLLTTSNLEILFWKWFSEILKLYHIYINLYGPIEFQIAFIWKYLKNFCQRPTLSKPNTFFTQNILKYSSPQANTLRITAFLYSSLFQYDFYYFINTKGNLLHTPLVYTCFYYTSITLASKRK